MLMYIRSDPDIMLLYIRSDPDIMLLYIRSDPDIMLLYIRNDAVINYYSIFILKAALQNNYYCALFQCLNRKVMDSLHKKVCKRSSRTVN